MINIQKIHELSKKSTAIDFNHIMFLYASVISLKPKHCLNLGIGPGTSSFAILDGLEYNQSGSLDCLDNFCDLNRGLSMEIINALKSRGAKIFQEEEGNFVKNCKNNSYDLILSDADHHHANEWVDEIFRIATHDAFLFFHDVTNDEFPNLHKYIEVAQKNNLPHFTFNKASRSDERCNKSGFLFVINKK